MRFTLLTHAARDQDRTIDFDEFKVLMAIVSLRPFLAGALTPLLPCPSLVSLTLPPSLPWHCLQPSEDQWDTARGCLAEFIGLALFQA